MSEPGPSDYYQILGVTRDATPAQVKAAYREASRRFHPDAMQPTASPEKFREATEAYEVLSDAGRRSAYDRELAGAEEEPTFASMFSDFAKATGFGSAADAGGVGSVFDQLFGWSSPPPASAQAAGEATGRRRPDPAGEAYRAARNQRVVDDFERAKRKSANPEVVAVDGTRVGLTGIDTHSSVEISLADAIFGTTISVATVGGVWSVRVPPGTKGGAKLRLARKGVPHRLGVAGTAQGDHVVTIVVAVPAPGDAAAVFRDLLARFSAGAGTPK